MRAPEWNRSELSAFPSQNIVDTQCELREPTTPRIYVREPGWTAQIKQGSERMHCYLIEPGEDHYHRIADGELHLVRGDERLCLRCADRLGLLHFEPKRLRTPARALELSLLHATEAYPLRSDDTGSL